MNWPGLGARPSEIFFTHKKSLKKCEKTLKNNNINNYKTRIVTKLNHLNYDQPKKNHIVTTKYINCEKSKINQIVKKKLVLWQNPKPLIFTKQNNSNVDR